MGRPHCEEAAHDRSAVAHYLRAHLSGRGVGARRLPGPHCHRVRRAHRGGEVQLHIALRGGFQRQLQPRRDAHNDWQRRGRDERVADRRRDGAAHAQGPQRCRDAGHVLDRLKCGCHVRRQKCACVGPQGHGAALSADTDRRESVVKPHLVRRGAAAVAARASRGPGRDQVPYVRVPSEQHDWDYEEQPDCLDRDAHVWGGGVERDVEGKRTYTCDWGKDSRRWGRKWKCLSVVVRIHGVKKKVWGGRRRKGNYKKSTQKRRKSREGLGKNKRKQQTKVYCGGFLFSHKKQTTLMRKGEK
eukprot:PhM_4_TR8368/c0_g1_i1/m.14576